MNQQAKEIFDRLFDAINNAADEALRSSDDEQRRDAVESALTVLAFAAARFAAISDDMARDPDGFSLAQALEIVADQYHNNMRRFTERAVKEFAS